MTCFPVPSSLGTVATILERWGLTAAELTELVDSNPSMRGLLLGYLSEFQLKRILAASNRVADLKKADDHDRKSKNDLALTYKGHRFTIEAKSLQTNHIKVNENDLLAGGATTYSGKYQVDASDCRDVKLPNGQTVKTTCLLTGEFDIIAVNLFGFREKWEFGFALNSDLPRSTSAKYTAEQQKYLLATLPTITLPLGKPYTEDIFVLLDKLVEERNKGVEKPVVKVVAAGEPKLKVVKEKVTR